MKYQSIAAAAGLLALSCIGAQATTISGGGITAVAVIADCDAPDVVANTLNTVSCGAAARGDITNIEIGSGGDTVLPSVDFYTLGIGGTLTFEITQGFTGPGSVVEVTGGGSTVETLEIFVGNDLNALSSIGTVTNAGAGTLRPQAFTVTGTYTFLSFVDRSTGGGGADGFDIDAFTISPVASVPLPAGAALLLTGLAGVGVAGRRRATRG